MFLPPEDHMAHSIFLTTEAASAGGGIGWEAEVFCLTFWRQSVSNKYIYIYIIVYIYISYMYLSTIYYIPLYSIYFYICISFYSHVGYIILIPNY